MDESTRAIYGYNFTIEYVIDEHIKMVPIDKGKDDKIGISGYLVGDIDDGYAYDIQYILSFIEQRRVLITKKCNSSTYTFPQSLSEMDVNIKLSGNRILLDDIYDQSINQEYIIAILEKTKKDKILMKAICLNVEATFSKYIDVEYFLLFSALESLVNAAYSNIGKKVMGNSKIKKYLLKTYGDEKGKDIYEYLKEEKIWGYKCNITEYLKSKGFNVVYQNAKEPLRDISNYKRVRNKLFHEAKIEHDGLKLNVYVALLRRFLPLIILKEIDVECRNINWDGWGCGSRNYRCG